MPTRSQIGVIKLGVKVCGLNDLQYRMLLRNVAGVDSSTKLTNHGVESVMATLEAMGFESHPAGPHYWRKKVAIRGEFCGERVVHKIHALAADQVYDLPGFIRRMTNGRTHEVERLLPHEGYAVIEALKAIVDRQESEGGEGTAGTDAPAHDEPAARTDAGALPF